MMRNLKVLRIPLVYISLEHWDSRRMCFTLNLTKLTDVHMSFSEKILLCTEFHSWAAM